MTIKEKLIAAGVRNLKEFGYPGVTKENILTDYVYARFFKSMLDDHNGNAKEVAELKAEIAKAKP